MSGPYNYGTLKLTVTSPVQTPEEPLSLADAAAYVGVHALDTEGLAILDPLRSAARIAAETLQNRDLVTKQYDLWLDCFPACVQLRDNLSSVDLIQYTDSDGVDHVVSSATYFVDTARGLVMPASGESWPSFNGAPSSAVLIRYTVTPPTLPESLLGGMKMLCSLYFNNRIPLELGASQIQEYDYTVFFLLSQGRKPMV